MRLCSIAGCVVVKITVVWTCASVCITSEQILQSGDKSEVLKWWHTEQYSYLYRVSYAERLQEYFAANDIDVAAKTHSILLSSCAVETYQLIVTWSFHTSQSTRVSSSLLIWFKLTTACHLRWLCNLLPLTIECNAREKQRLNSLWSSGNCQSSVSSGLPSMRCCVIDLCVGSKTEDFSGVC